MKNSKLSNPFKDAQRLFRDKIREFARQALKTLPTSSPAYQESRVRKNKPMDYLRCVEFPLAYQLLSLKDNTKLLDVASPQWFSLVLANRFPKIEFYYTNILQSELDSIRDIADCLGLKNIHYLIEDVRSLNFKNDFFDGAFSISTIEHIDPAVGGDVQALKEIHRVLKKNSEFILSVPFKKERSLVYVDRAVWERQTQARNFYLRNYDIEQVRQLAQDTGFSLDEKFLMFEKMGLFSMEYWEGEGQNRKEKNSVLKLKKKIDKLIGLRLESALADHYIRLERNAKPEDRLINLVARLVKP